MAVEYDGTITPQIPTRADRLWEQRRAYYWEELAEKRDPAILHNVPRGLPAGTPVLRFGGGRAAVLEDGRARQRGTYKFVPAGREASVVVIWEDPFAWEPEARRALCRFEDDTMSWCWDRKKPNEVPHHFAADTKSRFIVTFRRVD